MSIEHLTALMFVIAIASYVQTVTGFGLGMNRQPMELAVVRHMLLLVFAFTSTTRTILLGATGAGRHYPPPLSLMTMRRIAFGVLIVIGIGLMVSAMSEAEF